MSTAICDATNVMAMVWAWGNNHTQYNTTHNATYTNIQPNPFPQLFLGTYIQLPSGTNTSISTLFTASQWHSILWPCPLAYCFLPAHHVEWYAIHVTPLEPQQKNLNLYKIKTIAWHKDIALEKHTPVWCAPARHLGMFSGQPDWTHVVDQLQASKVPTQHLYD